MSLEYRLKFFEKTGFIWATVVEPLSILALMVYGKPTPPPIEYVITYIFAKSIFIVIICIGAYICMKHYNYSIQWRITLYSLVIAIDVMLVNMLKYELDYPDWIGYIVILCYRLGLIVSQTLFLIGLWSFINTYMGTRRPCRELVFKEALAVFSIFATGIMGFFTVSILLAGCSLSTSLYNKLSAIVYASGLPVSMFFIKNFLRLTKASLIRIYSVLALLIATMFFTIDYIYLLKYMFRVGELHNLMDLTLTIIGFAVIVVAILVLSGLDLISSIIFKPVTPLQKSTEQGYIRPKNPNIFLLEYYREEPLLSIDAIRLLVNSFIKKYRDIELIFIVSYYGSPLYGHILSIARANNLEVTTVYIIKGVGLPKYDKELGAYTSVFDGNHLKLIYDDRVGKRKALVILDNCTHYIMLYGVERVYNTINVFLSHIKPEDIVLILFNPEAHTSKERAYIRSLASNVLSIGF